MAAASYYLNPFAVERLTFETKRRPIECAQLLQAQLFSWQDLPEWSPTNPHLKDPVVGEVSVSGFTLRKWARYHRPFAVTARGAFAPTPEGSRVSLRWGGDRRVAAFVVFWFAFLVLVQVGILLGPLVPDEVALSPAGTFVPGLLALVGAALYLMARRKARWEGEFLADFVRNVLAAGDRAP